jgi:hypothetical protein
LSPSGATPDNGYIPPLDRLATLPAGIPELTLGWEAISFATKYLRHPNGPRAGERWKFTRSQVRFILWWYALERQEPDELTGIEPPPRWVYTHAARRLAKGAGKSPSAGLLSVVEFVGPVRFRQWEPEAPGGVIGKPVAMPLVHIAATAASQTANTMRVVRALMNKKSRLVREFGIDVGKTIFYCESNNGTLESITSSADAEEGAETTFAILDETEHWKPSNGGPGLADVMQRNLAKSNSRGIETCNAWEPGIECVAERTFDDWVAQEEGRTASESRVLYDALIAPWDTNMEDDASLTRGLAQAYGDCFWVDQRTIKGEVLSLRTDPALARRYYLNQPVSGATKWVARHKWLSMSKPDPQRKKAPFGSEIALFFDGSRTRDATALIGCHIQSGHVFTVGIWEPVYDKNGLKRPEPVPVRDVDAAVAWAFDKWNVLGFFADVREWESFTRVTWANTYGPGLKVWAVPAGKEPMPVAWDMRTHGHVHDFTMACELTWQEIEDGAFTHDGDSRLARHVLNAERAPNKFGVSISKESRDSRKKIDAAVCMIGARMVRRLVLAALAQSDDTRSGRVTGFDE